MKEYTATIKLNESELKDVIAEYFGIRKDNVFFTVVAGGNYNEGNYVNCEIHKKISVQEDSIESAYEHYCPNQTSWSQKQIAKRLDS